MSFKENDENVPFFKGRISRDVPRDIWNNMSMALDTKKSNFGSQ